MAPEHPVGDGPPATLEDFARLVGERVRMHVAPGQVIELELVEVTGLGAQVTGPAAPASRRAPFSLLFVTPEARVVPQRIYRLEGPRLGVMEIFLVPLGPDAQHRQRYEAVFA